MVQCSICGKQLKTTQGLQGHLRFSHPGQAAVTGVIDRVANPQASVDAQDQDGAVEVIAEALAHLDEKIGTLMLELPARAAAAVEAAMSQRQEPEPIHTHGICNDTNCQDCRNSINTVGKAAVDQVRVIPGVNEAIEFCNEMAKLEIKDFGWHMVPNAKQATEVHQLMNSPMDTLIKTSA